MAMDSMTRGKSMTDTELQAMLDRMDQQDESKAGRNRRSGTRIRFRKESIAMRVTHPGGGTTELQVTARDLSTHGISFLYRGFLHKGTEIRAMLPKRAGGHEAVEGSVAWCRHIIGPHHVVGVRFATPIFPKLFVDPGAWGELPAEVQVDPQTLSGTVLLVDGQEMDQMLFNHYLSQTAIQVKVANTGVEAGEAASQPGLDVILCELNLPDTTGEKLVATLRASGVKTPILALTAETSPARLRAAEQAGMGAIIPKPYDAQNLFSVLAGWLQKSAQAQAFIQDPIYSTLQAPEMQKMVEQYIEKVRTIAQQLQSAILADNLEQLRSLCTMLKGTGAGFGFSTLTRAATDAITRLDNSMSIPESQAEIERLRSICGRIAPMPAKAA